METTWIHGEARDRRQGASEETTSGVRERAGLVAGMMGRVDVRDLGREFHELWHLCRCRKLSEGVEGG